MFAAWMGKDGLDMILGNGRGRNAICDGEAKLRLRRGAAHTSNPHVIDESALVPFEDILPMLIRTLKSSKRKRIELTTATNTNSSTSENVSKVNAEAWGRLLTTVFRAKVTRSILNGDISAMSPVIYSMLTPADMPEALLLRPETFRSFRGTVVFTSCP